jgi:CheY-like chemotaxis protein
MMQNTKYDIVFLDLNMPKFDGLTVAKLVCEQFPLESRPKLVAMTANGKVYSLNSDTRKILQTLTCLLAMRGDREQCLQAGCIDYIAKPILIPELIRVLQLSHKVTDSMGDEEERDSKRQRIEKI